MTTIVKIIDIDATPEAVWAKIADTARVSNLIGFVGSSEQSGDVRVCNLEGGGVVVEKIVSVDHDLKRVFYSITESPLGMEIHGASMQIEENGAGARLVWTVDFLPAEVTGALLPLLGSAADDMKSTLAN